MADAEVITAKYGPYAGKHFAMPNGWEDITNPKDMKHASVLFAAIMFIGTKVLPIDLIEVEGRTEDNKGWIFSGYSKTRPFPHPSLTTIEAIKAACNASVIVNISAMPEKASRFLMGGRSLRGPLVIVMKSADDLSNPPPPIRETRIAAVKPTIEISVVEPDGRIMGYSPEDRAHTILHGRATSPVGKKKASKDKSATLHSLHLADSRPASQEKKKRRFDKRWFGAKLVDRFFGITSQDVFSHQGSSSDRQDQYQSHSLRTLPDDSSE
jgi:hypothetical protein